MVERTERVVETRKLTKVFRDFWLRDKVVAVSDLDMDIFGGEVFGLLGPNGSGKSTTLKMVLGLMYPTRGRIGVFGHRPTNVAVKSRIGFLPEESYLYPFLDARETLEFYGRLFHQPRRERQRRIDMLLDMVGLSAAAFRRVGEYSKGMQRRIGLAQALINDPDLLILDEPTSGMDPIGTKQFKDLIRTLAARGKTVILSSHLLADVEDVCDRVCVLYGGKKRAEGDVFDLLAHDTRTQIITDRIDEQTVEAIRELIRQRGGDVKEVSAPRQKLEDLFLQIVDEAQQQRMSTGGAVAGGKVAEFLKGEESEGGRAVIEQLLRPRREEEAEPETEPAPQPEPPQPAREVVEGLVAPEPEPEPIEPPAEAAHRDSNKDHESKVDRGVIDDLLDDSEEDRRG
ncbi:MAG: ABC transporter ATP-binding protein [Phycisphaerae bacterium]